MTCDQISYTLIGDNLETEAFTTDFPKRCHATAVDALYIYIITTNNEMPK